MYIAGKCPGRPFLNFLDSPLIKAVVKRTLKRGESEVYIDLFVI